MTEQQSNPRSYDLEYPPLKEADVYEALQGKSAGRLIAVLTTLIELDVRRLGQPSPPVRLHKIAGTHLIQPMPEIRDLAADGQIRYDPDREIFIITLGKPFFPSILQNRPRARFTYAHEFAHRFFFALASGTWSRMAVQVAATEGSGLLALRRIQMREELICNEVAAQVLVPTEMLQRHALFFRHPPTDCRRARQFYPEIERLAQLFDVSRICMLRRVRMVFSQLFRIHNFAFFVLSKDRAIGTAHGLRCELICIPDAVQIHSAKGEWLRRCLPALFDLGKMLFGGFSASQRWRTTNLVNSEVCGIPGYSRFAGWYRIIGDPQANNQVIVWGILHE